MLPTTIAFHPLTEDAGTDAPQERRRHIGDRADCPKHCIVAIIYRTR
jgi:hypothetical protein